jgi:hypothetical protein
MAFIGTAIGGLGGALLGSGVIGAGVLGGGLAGGAALGLAGASLGTALGSSVDAKNAASQAGQLASNLTYQPIDLNALQQQAQQTAQQNLANSIKLEQQYFPQAAAVRAGTQNLVNQEVQAGGRLTPDVSNAVTRAAMASGGAGGFGAGPLAAANLGLTSQQQMNNAIAQGQNQATATYAGLPTSGLDPGALASAAIGQNQQMNQFNIGKTGLEMNAIQSQAAANSGLAGSLGSAASLLGSSIGNTNLTNAINNLGSSNLSNSLYGNTAGLSTPNLGTYQNYLGALQSNQLSGTTTAPTTVNPYGLTKT